MTDAPYSNRELDAKFETIIEKLDEIAAQTTKTNGRVSSLENWRWFLIGGMSIMSAMVIPLVIYIWTTAMA